MAKHLKRSISIAGHRTSVSLEAEFWQELESTAQQEGKTIPALVVAIDLERGQRNLSSAIRVWILQRLKSQRERQSGEVSNSLKDVPSSMR